jgi:probable HAF family extracellular repeat protein
MMIITEENPVAFDGFTTCNVRAANATLDPDPPELAATAPGPISFHPTQETSMLHHAHIAIATVLLAVCGSTLGQPQFTGIGLLPGGTQSSAHGVSSEGTVVGLARGPAGGSFAVRWRAGTGLEQLGSQWGAAYAVTPDGATIVGSMAVDSYQQAFRWREGTGFEFLGALSAWWPESRAAAVSDDGEVIVGRAAISNFHHLAFRWTGAAGLENMGTLPGLYDPGSEALAISADGSVFVGYSSFSVTLATRWDSTGIHSLGALPGASDYSKAHGISADGQTIVGASAPTAGGFGREAFRWSAAGGMTSLGSLPGAEFMSTATAVNGDGSIIVGFAGPNYDATTHRAFIWTESAGMRFLHDELIALGTTGLENWTLRQATTISPDGRFIAGRGVNPQGLVEGWVVDFESPSCYANCDGSTAEPILNVEDFLCFIGEFAAALALPPAQQVVHYANCDRSTAEPVLNVEDFTCFMAAFAQGCP